EAAEILRRLIECITVRNDPHGHVVELTGDIVNLLTLPGGSIPVPFDSSVKVVAGACNIRKRKVHHRQQDGVKATSAFARLGPINNESNDQERGRDQTYTRLRGVRLALKAWRPAPGTDPERALRRPTANAFARSGASEHLPAQPPK